MSILGNTKKTNNNQRKSAKLPKLTIQQQIDNQEVIERMNRKITFTKNQRYLGKTLQYVEALNAQTNSSIFRIEPEYLLFTNYQSHHTYEGQIKLVNKTKHIQRIKIAPLKTKEFVVSSVKYPKDNSGDIASGMSVSIFVRFRPINLHDYEDQLVIVTGDGVVKVAIMAQRQKCQGKWPSQIDCGHCWVGDKTNKQVSIKNKGGQAVYKIKNSQNAQKYEIGFFEVVPAQLKVGKNASNVLNVLFSPEREGRFQQTIVFVSDQSQSDEIVINLVGGAYTARITLQQINGQKIRVQKFNNYLYMKDCQPGRVSESKFKIKNHAVVPVDYFWHFEKENQLKINEKWGKIEPAQIFQFSAIIHPQTRQPKVINASLYLYNLPKQSISTSSITKNINGVDAIECLKLEVRTSSQTSPLEVSPLHKKISQLIYLGHEKQVSYKVRNNSSTERKVSVELIKQDEFCHAYCLMENQQFISANSQLDVKIRFKINELVKVPQKAYFLVNFDNASSEMISVEGFVEFPNLRLFSSDVDFGLVRTNSHFRKNFKLINDGLNDVFFRIKNPHRFYQLDFYDFYEFESDQFYIDRLHIVSSMGECKDWMRVPAKGEEVLEFQLHTIDPQSINLGIDLEIMNGPTYNLNVLAEAQTISPEMSRNSIQIKEMYKGNIYNSNKLLSKELAIVNHGNIPCSYEIIAPETDKCNLHMSNLSGVVEAKSKKRLDLTVEPIKTGDFVAKYTINYYDNIPLYPEESDELNEIKENASQQRKSFYKSEELLLQSKIKGVQINYYIKDQSRARKVRQKVEDPQGSVKLSSYSLKSASKSQYFESQRVIYPFLEELNFYNCQINKVEQMEIFIENDSGLTAEYQIYAENFHTNEKIVHKSVSSSKGFNQSEEEAFTSEMGKTFLQARVLDKAQKVHLSNNKGISIMCEPDSGYLYKKQTQKIVITMFNDTSGQFKDSLVINVKDHEEKKFPINLNIKGTPVSLSRNQLGIDFRQQTPSLHTGTHFVHNGNSSRNIKVVNNGPKEVFLRWLFYPYGKKNDDKDLFEIKFQTSEPGNEDPVETKWLPIKPELDESPAYSVEPKQRLLKGREEATFILTTKEPAAEGLFQNLLIGEPFIMEKEEKRQMQSLAVVLSSEAVLPLLKIDQKHINHMNKFQRFAIGAPENSTNTNNQFRKIKLKNPHKSNITFKVDIQTIKSKSESFRIAFTDSNSPLTKFQKLPQKTFIGTKTKFEDIQRQFTLDYESYVEIGIELLGNPKDIDNWPMQEKIRKDGVLKIMYSNGQTQQIKLLGWLYRPWISIQMPNNLPFSRENFLIDFGVVHVKNHKKMTLFIANPSKSTASWNINYVKYHQTAKVKFQKQLWTDGDYEDQTITDEKKCFRLSRDSGQLYGKSIPIHYMPGTLALHSKDDEYATSHKPDQIDIVFKPELNVLYKSKFVISSQFGESFTIIVRGRGTYQEQKQIK